MPPVIHQRLLNEAILHGTGEILRQMPAEYTPELERAIRHGVRQALLCYTEGMDTLTRQFHPVDRVKNARD